jgi:hypothetical protein
MEIKQQQKINYKNVAYILQIFSVMLASISKLVLWLSWNMLPPWRGPNYA